MFYNISRKAILSILACLTSFLFIAWHVIPDTTTRAAIDVGSGSIKLTVAKVNSFNNKIYRVIYSQEHPVPFKRDMQVGGQSMLSEKIQKVAIEKLSQLKEELKAYRPSGWKGIATAASREAKNAKDLFDKIRDELGIDISIISQVEEGRLGFMTAAAVSGVAPEKLIAVDSGSGSFQISTLFDDQIKVVEGQLGYIPSLEMLMDIRGQKLDLQSLPEPVSLNEAVLLVEKLRDKMPTLPEDFLQKFKDPANTIVGIGNENFIFSMGATGVGKNTFTKEELWEAIVHLAGKPVEELKQFSKPNTAVLGMVLLYSIMDCMGLDQLTSCYANGSCEGLLVDTKYWN